jgi:hypothetical protein
MTSRSDWVVCRSDSTMSGPFRMLGDAGRDARDAAWDRGFGGQAGAVAARPAWCRERGTQGDGVDLRDGAGRGQHRRLRAFAGGQDAAAVGWLDPAPSTLGTFLRAFTFGHVRQLDRLLGEALVRAWHAGAGPGEGRLVVDVDSFVGEVCGRLKQGAAYGYTRLLGYHPILATRAETREVLHIRLRKGSANTQKGMLRFTEELIARVGRAGATGVKLLRADSGFWNRKVFTRLERAGWQYSIGVRLQKGIREAVEAIAEDAWQTIDYPDEGKAQIAETTHGGRRLIVRRTRLVGPQAQLWPDWRHFAFITNRSEEITLVEAEHREHAVVEQVIADLKEQPLAHFPSGEFNANGAWTVLAALAHNLLRWTQLIGLPEQTVRAARTLRRRWLQVGGRLTRHGRSWTLHLPARWPWQSDYLDALKRIRALPAA